jgi:hypothetical protein
MVMHKVMCSSELDSIEKRLGTIQVAQLSSFYVMAADGIDFQSLLSLRECIDAFVCTYWNICSITTTGGFNDKTEELIKQQKEQLAKLYEGLHLTFDYCQEVRTKKKMEIN